jgi:hypothetical protein
VFTIQVVNDGIGPGLVKSVQLLVDKQPVPDWATALDRGDVPLIVEIEVAVQVAPRGFSGFVMTRSRHEEELQQVG